MEESPRPSFTFDMLTAFSVAQTIFAAHQAGIWEPFESDPDHQIDPDAFARERGLDAHKTRGLIEYLARRSIFERAPDRADRYRLAPQGRALITEEWIPYFVFYVGGYGKVLGDAGAMLTGAKRYGSDLRRDGHYVALGSELMGRTRHARSYEAVFERAAAMSPETVADLGCGSAGFLLQLVQKSGARRGIGIDINHEACVLGEQKIRQAGLAERVQIFEGDAAQLLDQQPALEGSVDLVTAMFLVHEFLSGGFDVAAQKLRAVGRLLRPRTGRLILLEKHTDILEAGGTPPYFTEFKLVHDFTDQVLCTRDAWRDVLARAGFTVSYEKPLAPHTGSILFECAPAAG